MGVDIWMRAEVRRDGRWEADPGFGEYVTRQLELFEAFMNGPIEWHYGLPEDRAAHLDDEGNDVLQWVDEDEQPMWCTLAELEVVEWPAEDAYGWADRLAQLRALVPDASPRRLLRRREDPRSQVRVLAYWL